MSEEINISNYPDLQTSLTDDDEFIIVDKSIKQTSKLTVKKLKSFIVKPNLPGKKGDIGEKGEKGVIGVGLRGVKGEIGPTGLQGI